MLCSRGDKGDQSFGLGMLLALQKDIDYGPTLVWYSMVQKVNAHYQF